MPPVLIAVGAAVAGGAVSAGVSAAVGGGVLGAILGGVAGAATTVAVSYLGHKVLGSGETAAAPIPEQIRGRSLMVVQPITTHKVVYGRVRVGGPLALIQVRTSPGSRRKDMLHLAVIHAAHEVDGFETLYLNDQEVLLGPDGAATNSPWIDAAGPHVAAWQHAGAPDQPADAVLVAETGGVWTAEHRLRGRAWSHVRLSWQEQIFSGGVPNVSTVLRGRRVYDPRTGVTAWSDNAALCLLDWLRAPWGLSAPLDEIDFGSFVAAANLCDEPVAALAGSSEPRYTCNGVVDLATRRTDALSALLSSCAGSLIWTGGRWRLLPGAWRPATAALSEAELRAPVTVRPHRSWRELANTCRGTFSSPAHQWQPTDYPPVQVPAYLALDGGEEVTLTLDLPFTTSHTMAQRIGRIALHQLRHALTVDYPANLAGLRLTAGDTVALSLSRCGLDQVPMAVRSWTLSAEGGVDLALGRDDAAVYAHDPALLQALA